MGRGPVPFKQRDATRLAKAAQAAGIQNPVIEIHGGTIRVYGGDNVKPLSKPTASEESVSPLEKWKAKRESQT